VLKLDVKLQITNFLCHLFSNLNTVISFLTLIEHVAHSILNMTYQVAACDAASVQFCPTIRTDKLAGF